MIIRDMEVGDMDFLSALYFQFWGDKSDPEKMREKFSRLKNNPAYILLSAADGDRVVGSVMGVICEELYGDCQPFLVLENMVVDEDFRKKGVGRLLYAELEKRAKTRGCGLIQLVTEANRKDARGFYEAMGFHPTAHRGFKKTI